MKNVLYLLSFVLIFSNCSTTVFLTRTNPPELVLESRPGRIVFSNQFNYQANAGIKDKHEAAYKTGIEEFVNTLVNDTLHENPIVIFLIDTTASIHKTNGLFEGMMPKEEISSVCRAFNADYLLSLDSADLHFEWEVIREEDPMDGSVSKTKDFYLFNNYYVTLYDTTGGIIKRTCLEKSHYYTSRLSFIPLFTILPKLGKAEENIVMLASVAAMEYLGMFYPSEASYAQRKLYTGKVFKETNSLIFSRQYENAIGLLQQKTNSPKQKLAMKAQHNLNVARELHLNCLNSFK